MSDSHALFTIHRKAVSLFDAKSTFAGTLDGASDRAVGLLYAPNWCGFVSVTIDGSLTWKRKNQLATPAADELDDVFEARLFHKRAELRWLRDPLHDQHTAVILCDNKFAPSDWHARTAEPESFETLNQHYLLWGKASANFGKDDWITLVTSQIGTLHVPPLRDEIRKGQRVRLQSREYLKAYDPHGNVAVFEERLLGLEVGDGRRRSRQTGVGSRQGEEDS
jgi:CRISPR-associated protein (TIGR03984 family)